MAVADEHRTAWQEIAAQDPDWAVLSLPHGKRGGWDPDALRVTGHAAVAELLAVAEQHAGPLGFRLAVDVGCGVGRLTGALAERFERVVGVDVTPAMLDRARRRTRHGNVAFVRADVAHEAVPQAGGADLVLSERVVQHLPAAAVAPHVRGLVRLLHPGGVAVVQVPVALPWTVRLQPRRRLYRLLRRCGVPPNVLYWRLGLHPMSMRVVSVATLARAVDDLAELVGVTRQHEPTFDVDEAVVVLRRRTPDAGP